MIRRTARLSVVVVVAMVVAVTAILLGVRGGSGEDRSAASVPSDLCAVIGKRTVARLVPGARRNAAGVYSKSEGANANAGCAYTDTAPRPPDGPESYAFLTVRVLRHAQVSGVSGFERARSEFGSLCEAPGGRRGSSRVKVLGRSACLATGERDRTATANLRVRRGPELFWVDYTVHPGREAAARRGANVVAKRMLNGISPP